MIARVLIHVEGQTEETYVNELLAGHLEGFGQFVSARILGNPRARSRRGGIVGWDSAARDITAHLKGDPTCFATLMVDYYGLPQREQRAWPGRAEAARKPFADKLPTVQRALRDDIARLMGESFNPDRFAAIRRDARVRGAPLQRLCRIRFRHWTGLPRGGLCDRPRRV